MASNNSENGPSPRPGQLPRPASEFSEAIAPVNFAREFQAYGFLFLNKLWLIGIIVFLGTILTASYVLSRPKLYTATATVQVELHDRSEIKAQDMNADEQTGLEQLNTIVGKFESRPLLASVLVEAGLLSSNSLAVFSPMPSTNPAVAIGMSEPELKLLKSFEMRVKVMLRRNTRLIDISVKDANPNQAAKLANRMVEEYFKQDFSMKSTTSKTVGEFFKAEYERLKEKVQASEQALQDYVDQVGTVQVANPKNDEIPGYQQQLPTAKADLFRFRSAYDKSLAMGTNVDELLAYSEITADPQVESYQKAIAQSETELMALKQQYREKNPKYIVAVNTLADLKAQLARKVLSMREQIQESCRLPYENAVKTVEGLEAELAKSEAKNVDLSRKSIRYNMLAQELAANRDMFSAVSQRLNEMTASAQLAPANISVVVPASPPDVPSSPKTKQLLLMGFIGFLGLGIFLVWFLDGFNTALRTVDAAENYLQLPVLSAFPRLKFDHRDYRKQLVAANGNGRPADLELFRTLRASLSMLDKEERRSFLFTSSFANEGKTFAACNFAASLAQQGLRTVVLDLDLRKPHVEKFFTGQMDRTPGVTDILQNHKKLTEVAQAQPGMDNLSWVAAGGATSENLELLSPELFRKLLEQALQKYDRVVIDTPPIHPVKDALLMAKEVSAVITLVDGSKTARRAVAKTIQWLRNANAPVAGVVLNRLSRSRNGQGFYYHDFCGYGYGAYGHPGREKIENREVENMK